MMARSEMMLQGPSAALATLARVAGRPTTSTQSERRRALKMAVAPAASSISTPPIPPAFAKAAGSARTATPTLVFESVAMPEASEAPWPRSLSSLTCGWDECDLALGMLRLVAGPSLGTSIIWGSSISSALSVHARGGGDAQGSGSGSGSEEESEWVGMHELSIREAAGERGVAGRAAAGATAASLAVTMRGPKKEKV